MATVGQDCRLHRTLVYDHVEFPDVCYRIPTESCDEYTIVEYHGHRGHYKEAYRKEIAATGPYLRWFYPDSTHEESRTLQKQLTFNGYELVLSSRNGWFGWIRYEEKQKYKGRGFVLWEPKHVEESDLRNPRAVEVA